MAPPPSPPPVPKNGPQHVQEMMEKYKIRFLGPADMLGADSWPANLCTTLKQVRKLGHTDYDTYAEDARSDAAQLQPWRCRRPARARTLAKVAARCLDARKIESGWRFAIENLVFDRFFVEVACKTCRGRLWRSEEEVAPGSSVQGGASDGDNLLSLQDRQDRRKPCECPANRSRDEPEDGGLNPIFDDRPESAIVYTDEMQEDLRRREHRPDRIFGLFQSRTIKSLLGKPDRRYDNASMTVRRAIDTTPFNQDGRPIVFPFLVIEAKSEKSADSFSDIDMQTAFAIRQLVMLQGGLERAASGLGHAEWDAAPLVWYFSYRGEQWRVHAAFPRPTGDAGAVDVIRLWSGDIDSARGALQVLLLVDYICDWARDKFRESVIRSLAVFSQSNRQGTVASETLSLRAATATPAPTLRPDAMNEITDSPTRVTQAGTGQEADYRRGRYLDPDEQKKLVDLPLHQSPVRDIRFLTLRSSGVLITKDNLELLRKSSPSDKRFSSFASDIRWALVFNGFKTTWDALERAQAAWLKEGSGPYPDGPGLVGPRNTKYFALMSISWYLSASWGPVKELYWLAIEESALPYLEQVPYGDGHPGLGITGPYSRGTFDAGDIEKVLGGYTDIGARLNIAACLLGTSRRLKSVSGFELVDFYDFYPPVLRPSSRTYGSFPSVDNYGEHAGAIVPQLHSDYESGRLGSCTDLVYQVSYEHIVNRADLGDIALKKLEQSLGGEILLGLSLQALMLDVGTPLLVIDPQELDPVTETPAHCTFVLEEGPPRRFLSHATGSYKMYFVAERVLDGKHPRMAFINPYNLTRKLIPASNSDNVWLVQPPLGPAEEADENEEEGVEDTPEQPVVFDTTAPTSEIVSSVGRSEVADWAHGVKHEVIVVDSDDEEGVDHVTGGLRDIPARPASPGPAQEQSQSLSVPRSDGQELEDHNGAGEGASRSGSEGRGSKCTSQVGTALRRRSKRISTAGRM